MDLAIDTTSGDLVIEGGDLKLLEGIDSIVQDIAVRLQFFQGEWFLDTRIGIPYFGSILVKNPDLGVVRFLLRSTVSSTPGITNITRFDLDFDAATRVLRVDFDAETEEGPFTFDRELILV
jgi:hypothetical protein